MHTFMQQNVSIAELCSHCYYKPLVLLKLLAPAETADMPSEEGFIFIEVTILAFVCMAATSKGSQLRCGPH